MITPAAHASTPPAPILKYAGGKTKLLPEILRRIPARFGRYHEPFVGGGAVFFALAREGRLECGADLSDVNPDVVNLYRAIAWNVRDVIEELEILERQHRKAPVTTYRRVRRERNKQLAQRVKDPDPSYLALCDDGRRWAATVLYLNRTCFNGLWRVNRAGDFNVPLGDYAHKRISIVRADALRAAAGAFGDGGPGHGQQEARVHLRDFAIALVDAKPGDLVYADPPYLPVSATSSFAHYAAGGFGLDRQRELAAALAALAARGVHVIASNADTPIAREIYAAHADHLAMESVDMPRAINSSSGRRGKISELLITSATTRGTR